MKTGGEVEGRGRGAEIGGKRQVPGLERLPRHPCTPCLPLRISPQICRAVFHALEVGLPTVKCFRRVNSGGECGAPRGGEMAEVTAFKGA